MSDKIRTTLASKKDFRLDWFSGTGAGGQHRNKHQNCCRITHIPTGLVETGQTSRERPANQRHAFQKLAKRIVAQYASSLARERAPAVETIRNYHAVRNVVKDKASGLEMSYSEIVGKNNLAPMIDARCEVMAAARESDARG